MEDAKNDIRGTCRGATSFLVAEEGPVPETTAYFSFDEVQTLRESARAAARSDYTEVWASHETSNRGWIEETAPKRVLDTFPELRIRDGYLLRAYVERDGFEGSGTVWAVPSGSLPEVPERDFMGLAPQTWAPAGALPDFMDAVEGDGSLRSFLSASLFRREVREIGWSGHSIGWNAHDLLGANPLLALPRTRESDADGDLPVEGSNWRPSGSQADWTILDDHCPDGSLPTDWRPSVHRDDKGARVRFYSFSSAFQERIVRHLDSYPAGNYRAEEVAEDLASGPRGWMV